MSSDPAATLSTMLGRALRRRCPRCGAPAFASWFLMHDNCPRCGLHFEREQGYFVGAVVINTIVIFATFIVMFGGMVLLTWPDVPWTTVLIVTAVANVAIPSIFYPMSKTVWSALDLSWHPLEPAEIVEARSRSQRSDV